MKYIDQILPQDIMLYVYSIGRLAKTIMCISVGFWSIYRENGTRLNDVTEFLISIRGVLCFIVQCNSGKRTTGSGSMDNVYGIHCLLRDVAHVGIEEFGKIFVFTETSNQK